MSSITRRFTESVTRVLECVLYEHEVRERAVQLAGTMVSLEEIDIRHKEEVTRMKGTHGHEREPVAGRVKSLLKSVKDQTEDRNVECEWVYDLSERRTSLVRKDTGEIVEKAYMTEKEFDELSQLTLPLSKQAGWATSPANPANRDAPPVAPALTPAPEAPLTATGAAIVRALDPNGFVGKVEEALADQAAKVSPSDVEELKVVAAEFGAGAKPTKKRKATVDNDIAAYDRDGAAATAGPEEG